MKGTSVIKRFLESKNKKQLMLDRIAECHTIANKQLVHMLFTSNGKCLVFERQTSPAGMLGVYLSRETFSKEDLKYRQDLNLKFENLRGDLACVF